MSLEITGKIVEITPIEIGTSSGGKEWSKRYIVVKSDGQYDKPIPVQLFGQDLCDKVHGWVEGNEVKCSLNLGGSKSAKDGRWFANIGAWKVELLSESKVSHEVDIQDDLPF